MIYQVETAKHFCWKATREELVSNRIFYEFKDKDLVQLEHPFLGLIETPLVLRALRHGVMLKLEDLYMPFIQAVDMITQSIGRKEGVPEEKKVAEDDTHLLRVQAADKAREKAKNLQEAAKEEIQQLLEICEKEKESFEKEISEKGALAKAWYGENHFKILFSESIESGKLGDFSALNQFMYFTADAERFFSTSF